MWPWSTKFFETEFARIYIGSMVPVKSHVTWERYYITILAQPGSNSSPTSMWTGGPTFLACSATFRGIILTPYPSNNLQHSILRMVNSNSYLYPCSSLESFRENLIGLFHPIWSFYICYCLFYQGEVIQGTGHKVQGLLHLGAVYLCINTSWDFYYYVQYEVNGSISNKYDAIKRISQFAQHSIVSFSMFRYSRPTWCEKSLDSSMESIWKNLSDVPMGIRALYWYSKRACFEDGILQHPNPSIVK